MRTGGEKEKESEKENTNDKKDLFFLYGILGPE